VIRDKGIGEKRPMKFGKWAAVWVVMLLCVFMASAAMAVNVTNRSAEMDDFSACDRAGTIEYRFTQADWLILAAHLATNDFARIRVALNGLSLPRHRDFRFFARISQAPLTVPPSAPREGTSPITTWSRFRPWA
jgi:hypothetical protein